MYGARPIADLPVTRFYAPKSIYDLMKRIHEFDAALRAAFGLGCQLQRMATMPTVLLKSSIHIIH
jgi:hypothetical protein